MTFYYLYSFILQHPKLIRVQRKDFMRSFLAKQQCAIAWWAFPLLQPEGTLAGEESYRTSLVPLVRGCSIHFQSPRGQSFSPWRGTSLPDPSDTPDAEAILCHSQWREVLSIRNHYQQKKEQQWKKCQNSSQPWSPLLLEPCLDFSHFSSILLKLLLKLPYCTAVLSEL